MPPLLLLTLGLACSSAPSERVPAITLAIVNIDTAVHYLEGGQRLASVQLRDAPAPAEFSSRIGAFASSRRTRRGGSIRACWRIWR